MAREKRFEEVFKQGSEFSEINKIIVDKETGVNYLVWKSGYAGGITPLLDSNGKPIIGKPIMSK
ncbi:hypothetical protein P261_02645 [Lachnospiraceae bacterium TWA4]|nr:hypothetical protein P261_02645 [Lachnospiraceae bacterium TWA4]